MSHYLKAIQAPHQEHQQNVHQRSSIPLKNREGIQISNEDLVIDLDQNYIR